MSRDADYLVMRASTAAASAGTLYLYFQAPGAFVWEGFAWGYQTAEANTDNTLDFAIASDIDKDGTFDNASDALFTNGNPNGLLDSMAIGVWKYNFGNAASGGATGIAVTPTVTRIAQDVTIRVAVVTAGTGTIPAINFAIYGKSLSVRS